MVLAGKGAAEFRRTCAQYVVRVFAGDVSLIDKINDNNNAFSQSQEGRNVQEAMLLVWTLPGQGSGSARPGADSG